ncbi:MAG: AMP-binding protein [Verrucomicrobia bacterium]|nr:AMP-binding protein [Verrucomicrobiota bacterium]
MTGVVFWNGSSVPHHEIHERIGFVNTARGCKCSYRRRRCTGRGGALFAQQAMRTPDGLAVVSAGDALTYRQLDQRAAGVATMLRGRGVGPDVVVAVGVERSLDLAVAVLGILKAGGAYLPLDPEYPANRLAFLLTDAQVPVLLTQRHLAARFPAAGEGWPEALRQRLVRPRRAGGKGMAAGSFSPRVEPHSKATPRRQATAERGWFMSRAARRWGSSACARRGW